MRVLPWTGEDGRPAYVDEADEDSFVTRLADGLESVQLAMAERLLRNVEAAWADRRPDTDLTGMVPHLCHALRDSMRMTRRLRERLLGPGPVDQDSSARVYAVLAREIALDTADFAPTAAQPEPVEEGPESVAYRWPAESASVPAARRTLRRCLERWDMAELTDSAELVVTELAANAVRHASGPDDRLIEIRFGRLTGGRLRIEVHDTDDTKPERDELSAEAESGRGLLLVEALTDGRWGVGERDGVGKLVWAECAPADEAASAVETDKAAQTGERTGASR
jgi:anti-sigma regulatory factor (Ser/Thr protein kinase)